MSTLIPISIVVVVISLILTLIYFLRRKPKSTQEINGTPPKFPLALLLFSVLIISGCSLFKVSTPSPADELSKLREQYNEAKNKLTETETVLSKTNETLVRLKSETGEFLNSKEALTSLNHRRWETFAFIALMAWFVIKAIFFTLWKIFLDVLMVAAFTIIFTIVTGFIPYIMLLPKLAQAVLSSMLGCLIFWLCTNSSFLYFPAVAVVGWGVAVIIWWKFIKKPGLNTRAGQYVYSILGKRLKVKGVGD